MLPVIYIIIIFCEKNNNKLFEKKINWIYV